MGLSKVLFNNEVFIDLTNDTADSNTVHEGYNAVSKDGSAIMGTAVLNKTNSLIDRSIIGSLESNATSVHGGCFAGCTGITSLFLPNATSFSYNSFCNMDNVETIDLPNCTGTPFVTECFASDYKLQGIVLPKYTQGFYEIFQNCTSLQYADFGPLTPNITRGNPFNNDVNLKLIILRKSSSIFTISAVFANTPFKNGGEGGTIYIPKVLYDELGTGSSLDYKAATNWSTMDTYGTITWACIEGSQYQNYYADGTPIPATS